MLDVMMLSIGAGHVQACVTAIVLDREGTRPGQKMKDKCTGELCVEETRV